MDAGSELLWTLIAIGAMDVAFVLWWAAQSAKRGRPSRIVPSAELLGARARRSRI